MNDEIKKLIREILGDFPEGFNAGVVAGVPGWAGDIGYLLQEYPRALLTDTPLRPPVEYAGTTDSIAKAAGYEIPGTISGQLGAAVGGLLSPGPGDLAKFAPLLGAIPFWHGSPHKFDAFDLSKMGTGEGAQAYGWGAYGAEAQSVAAQYAGALADKNRDTVNNAIARTVHISGGDSNPSVLRNNLILEGFNANDITDDLLKEMRAVISGTASDGTVSDGALKAYRRLEALVPADKQLYRGEYAWPDPAKEAATPLTGEDLLQWDKPLSEQPKIVEALRKAGMWDGPGKWAEATGAKGQDLVAIMEAKKGEKGAADFLSANGIPGIRYLDGMSRDGGSGTYNYVMFDDKGIKLLERNGKPIRGLLNP